MDGGGDAHGDLCEQQRQAGLYILEEPEGDQVQVQVQGDGEGRYVAPGGKGGRGGHDQHHEGTDTGMSSFF